MRLNWYQMGVMIATAFAVAVILIAGPSISSTRREEYTGYEYSVDDFNEVLAAVGVAIFGATLSVILGVAIKPMTGAHAHTLSRTSTQETTQRCGSALIALARVQPSPEAAETLRFACRLFGHAAENQPVRYETYYGWSSAAMALSHVVSEDERTSALNQAEQALLKAHEIRPGSALYNLACLAALRGQSDAAFELLKAAFSSGQQKTEFAENDIDLAPLRADPRWHALASANHTPAAMSSPTATVTVVDLSEPRRTEDVYEMTVRSGAALRELAESQPGPEATEALRFAYSLFSRLAEKGPLQYEAGRGWGSTAIALSRVVTDEERTQVLNEAERILSRADQLEPGRASYNRACVAALLGRRDEALAFLATALQTGARKVEFAERDKDLESLHSDPRWHALTIANRGPTATAAATQSPYKKTDALWLCIFLGVLGVHRFYVGQAGLGIVWLLTAGLFGVGWIVDLVLIASGQFYDSRGRRLT